MYAKKVHETVKLYLKLIINSLSYQSIFKLSDMAPERYATEWGGVFCKYIFVNLGWSMGIVKKSQKV